MGVALVSDYILSILVETDAEKDVVSSDRLSLPKHLLNMDMRSRLNLDPDTQYRKKFVW